MSLMFVMLLVLSCILQVIYVHNLTYVCSVTYTFQVSYAYNVTHVCNVICILQVSDRVRDVTLEPGVVDGQLTPTGDGLHDQTVEGFLCPTCYTNFTSAELLQVSYYYIR